MKEINMCKLKNDDDKNYQYYIWRVLYSKNAVFGKWKENK